MTLTKGGEAWRQESKYRSTSPYSSQRAMELSRSSVNSDSSAPSMTDDQQSDISVEDVYAQYHMSGDDLWDTFWYPSDDEWDSKGTNDYLAANTASQLPKTDLRSISYEVRTHTRSPETKTAAPMVPTSRPRTPSRQRTPKPSRPTTYSLFPRPLEAPIKPSMPPRSSSLPQVPSPSKASLAHIAVPPVPTLPSMSAQANVDPEGSFASIGAVLEAPMPATPHLTSSPFRSAPAPPTTPSSADSRTSKLASLDSMEVPTTPTREKRWGGTYRPFTSTAHRPSLRNRSASTTAHPTISGSGAQDYHQVPKTPMRPRTQGSGLSRPTGDLGQGSFFHNRLHSSSSRPNLRPTTSHQKSSSSATYLSTVTPPPTPDAISAGLSFMPLTAAVPTEAPTATPNLKSVFDLDSDDEGDNDSKASSMLKRFVLRPFTSKAPSASANSVSPHKRSQSDGKKSLSNGKRVEAAKERHTRARGATEGAAGPFLPVNLTADGVIATAASNTASNVVTEIAEEKEPERPRLKRKESFAQFLGWGLKN